MRGTQAAAGSLPSQAARLERATFTGYMPAQADTGAQQGTLTLPLPLYTPPLPYASLYLSHPPALAATILVMPHGQQIK